jgi:hypothetical protein
MKSSSHTEVESTQKDRNKEIMMKLNAKEEKRKIIKKVNPSKRIIIFSQMKMEGKENILIKSSSKIIILVHLMNQ